MVRQGLLVVHVMVFSWLINITTILAYGADADRSRCPTSCGNLSNIPFPFGIGSSCYLDSWFEIVCNKSTLPHIPFLKRTNLQVLNITLEDYNYARTYQQIQVKNPITYNSLCMKPVQPSLNLTGSPFELSVSDNLFAAVSCDKLALMLSSNTHESQVSAGCKSICSKNRHNKSCDGVNCCQTTIPPKVETFTVKFESTGNDSGVQTCNYAFVVDGNWFMSNSTNFDAIYDMDYVPVTLNWYLSAHYPEIDMLRKEMNRQSSIWSYSCSNSTDGMVVTCMCEYGFTGNAYLPNGCQDVNECELRDGRHEGICRGATCVNTVGSFECRRPKVKLIIVGFFSGIGGLFLLIGAWGLYKFIKKRKEIKRRKQFFERNGGLLLQQYISSGDVNVDSMTKLFNPKELQKATDNFNADRILGQGGQGTVYKGMLADGKIVAVKKSKLLDEGNVAEFINEVVVLSQINHRNVVRVLGCCLETEVPLLVYEFIPNGTLFEYIHDQSEEIPFTWEMRLRIVTEIAGALFYLHSAASFPIYHRDIKSSNILLDDKCRAKVADFGTSKTISIGQTHVTTLVHGTFGYLDPEYFQSSQFTEKSDVYSFGVVMVELLTGQKPISLTRLEEGPSLATYFMVCMEENRLFDIIDARIVKDLEEGNEEIVAVANLARRCLNLNGKFRPTMKEVAMELEAIQKSGKTCSSAPENSEQVEFLRREVTEAWEFPTSIGSNPCTGSTLSLYESPLLSLN